MRERSGRGPGRPTKSPIRDGLKLCSDCGEWKQLDDFPRCTTIKCGRRNRCKQCHNRWQTPNPKILKLPADERMRRRRARRCAQAFVVRSPLGKLGVFEVFDPREIFERDGWVCLICRRAVDPAAARNSPTQPTIDHVIAVALGGIHARGNVQLAHRGCNAVHHHEHRVLK